MKNNFAIKFKKVDVFVIMIAIILILLAFISTNIVYKSNLNDKNKIEIYYQGKLLENYDISFDNLNKYEKDEDGNTIIVLKKDDYSDLLGDFKILINKEKGICVKDVTCPNHICERQGWVKKVGYPIVCLPNGVYVVINSTSTDIDIGIG